MEFAEFFKAVHRFEPFPWQRMLAERVEQTGEWPAVIDLPTASGKTAVLDVAVWALARQAERSPRERTAPRRIWFVVDRRIVVDAAFERAKKIRTALAANSDLGDIASALKRISGTSQPLAIGRLRGGVIGDDRGWPSIPTQPAILTSTVDQFGSRLLFRGYGMSARAMPIHAALAGNDSLVVLDEAHIAEPLVQTLGAVRRFRGGHWAEQPLPLPWQMTVMSATSPEELDAPGSRFPAPAQRTKALSHPELLKRMTACKRAKLVPADTPRPSRSGARPAQACVAEAVEHAKRMVADGRVRVAVMLNRVDAAVMAYRKLADELKDIDSILLTGRMRPFDRDRLVEQWQGVLASGSDASPELPIVLVTTQCLEVGADFSFDGLVTECASLDALRQRFGRLDRLGDLGDTEAVILAWDGDLNPDRTDPIYGPALRHTWKWLRTISIGDVVDFGISSVENLLATVSEEQRRAMLPPRRRAPVMLPAYIDAWCQTGSPPAIEPEVSLFLHGIGSEDAEVQVVLRADLTGDAQDQWAELVCQTPPVSGEMLPVRLSRLRRWLRGEGGTAQFDVEGAADEAISQPPASEPPRTWVIYRGQTVGGDRGTFKTRDISAIVPGTIVVLPVSNGVPAVLGHSPDDSPADIYEQALAKSGRIQRFRINPRRLARLFPDDGAATETIDKIRDWFAEDEEERDRTPFPLDDLLRDAAPGLRHGIERLGTSPMVEPSAAEDHGVILVAKYLPENESLRASELDPFADDDDGLSRGAAVEVLLADHAMEVADTCGRFAGVALPELAQVFEHAALRHDDGKCDPRFQALLRGAIIPYVDDRLLAKSSRGPSPRDRELRRLLRLPPGFRHEMLSMQLTSKRDLDLTEANRDLLLHLIASHHGFGRPWAPLCVDEDDMAHRDATIDGVTLTAGERNDPPPHRLDSGVAERFWRLTRRYGWWGLAYLESMFRLADQHASRSSCPPTKLEAQHA